MDNKRKKAKIVILLISASSAVLITLYFVNKGYSAQRAAGNAKLVIALFLLAFTIIYRIVSFVASREKAEK